MNHYRTRILLVDDDESSTKRLKTSLELRGEFEVRTENVSRHAMNATREFHPDILILDEDMPELQGGQVAERLRDDPGFHTPIIFLTALIPEREEDQPHGGGRDRLIAKPVNIEKLIRVIREELARSGSNPAPLGQAQVRPTTEDPDRPGDLAY